MNAKHLSAICRAALAGLALGTIALRAAPPEILTGKDHLFDDKKVVGHRTQHDGSGPAKSTGGAVSKSTITYHNGPVMLGTVNVYTIWYGNWTGNTAPTIISDFLNSLGGSPYWNMNTTYYNGSKTPLQNALAYLGTTTDNYSQGTSLSDSQIRTVVSSAISSGRLPSDANGIYLVLTSADVTASSGFCTQYCGWHTYATLSSKAIKYAFIGNPARCPSACAAQTTGPNDNAGADAMISIITHELTEAATDPQLNAWYDGSGAENADKCAWKFGTTYITSNGARANVHLGTRDYLIQQNWVNSGSGYCALKY